MSNRPPNPCGYDDSAWNGWEQGYDDCERKLSVRIAELEELLAAAQEELARLDGPIPYVPTGKGG